MAKCPWCGSTDLSYRDDSVEWDPENPMKGFIVTFAQCFTKDCKGEKVGWAQRTPFTLDREEN